MMQFYTGSAFARAEMAVTLAAAAAIRQLGREPKRRRRSFAQNALWCCN
jgi:hypothetical protein